MFWVFFRYGLNGIAFLFLNLLILNCDPDDSSDSKFYLYVLPLMFPTLKKHDFNAQ